MTPDLCGIDVSKLQLDCCVVPAAGPPRTTTLPNTRGGHTRLLRGLPAGALVVLEPTGPYHEGLLQRLEAAGVPVRLVNPRHVRRFAQAAGLGAKTDPLDAALLVRYAAAIPGRLHTPPRPAQRRLRALCTRLRQLDALLAAERCRHEQTRDPLVRRSVQRVVRTLERERAACTTASDALGAETPALAAAARLLRTIPGVGPGVVRTLLAELPDLRTFRDAAELAAYVGLAPVVQQSGTSLHRARLSGAGKPHVRATLYWPAIVATRYNPDVRAVYQRLQARGTPPKVARTAAMHKLLRICYGVLKHQQPSVPHTT